MMSDGGRNMIKGVWLGNVWKFRDDGVGFWYGMSVKMGVLEVRWWGNCSV